jgi:tetrapyrrole methylase family protein/MazG family protein
MPAAGSDAAREAAAAAFGELYAIVARLRAPDGCPWDREQTPRSMRGALVEEAYELVEAIDEFDPAHTAEEAGDLVLNILMVAYMHEEAGDFSVAGSLALNAEKLVRRHPHVFGDAKADTSEKVLAQWAEIKEKVEGRPKKDSLLDGVSKALPTLERAWKLQKKAAKAGFDWPDTEGPWAKAHEELDEIHEAVLAAEADAARRAAARTAAAARPAPSAMSGIDLAAAPAAAASAAPAADEGPDPRLEEEIGDLIFSIVNISRAHGVDPSLALARANEKFTRRFRHVERRMAEEGLEMKSGALDAMDAFWEEAKRLEKEAR